MPFFSLDNTQLEQVSPGAGPFTSSLDIAERVEASKINLGGGLFTLGSDTLDPGFKVAQLEDDRVEYINIPDNPVNTVQPEDLIPFAFDPTEPFGTGSLATRGRPDPGNPLTQSTESQDQSVSLNAVPVFIYQLSFSAQYQQNLAESTLTLVDDLGNSYSNARTPLKLIEYTYFHYADTLWVLSPDPVSQFNLTFVINRTIQQISGSGQSILDLSFDELSSIQTVESKGLRFISALSLGGATGGNFTSYSRFSYNTHTRQLFLLDSPQAVLNLYDSIDITGTREYANVTPIFSGTLLDYSSIPNIFTIRSITYNNVRYQKTLDRTTLAPRTLFFNKYTDRALLVNYP